MIQVKRVYDQPEPGDGTRFLVERLWARGMKKADPRLDGWLKEAAPSAALRRWFEHDPAKWADFQRCYWSELDRNPEAWWPIVEAAHRGNVTLLYSARDTAHNNAAALKVYRATWSQPGRVDCAWWRTSRRYAAPCDRSIRFPRFRAAAPSRLRHAMPAKAPFENSPALGPIGQTWMPCTTSTHRGFHPCHA